MLDVRFPAVLYLFRNTRLQKLFYPHWRKPNMGTHTYASVWVRLSCLGWEILNRVLAGATKRTEMS